MKRINALTIAGTDPSGGAGIQADLKTFSALGAYGCSVITALVAQNTRGVQSVYRIEPDFVAAQLDSVFSDVRIDTTKIGMLAETDIVEAVAERLQRYQIQNVVLDTVMLAKSGDPLLSPSAVATLRSRLLPHVSLITPNLPEAAALLDAPHARTEQEMLEQGRSLLAIGCGAHGKLTFSDGKILRFSFLFSKNMLQSTKMTAISAQGGPFWKINSKRSIN